MPNIKTLIVFDTNKIRSTANNSLSYGTFEVSADFTRIDNFIKTNNLTEYVHIAIPRIVIQELLKQKQEQYDKDINNFSIISKRLEELPNTDFGQIKLPSEVFDCRKHLEKSVNKFLQTNEISVIELDPNKMKDVLQRIIQRSINRNSPFKGREPTDSGFKDVVIWESILNYDELAKYDKVILVSNDAGFNKDCEIEFQTRFQKYISINPSAEFIINEITEHYSILIKMNDFADFVKSDYFKDHIKKQILRLQDISINNEKCKVIKSKVKNYFNYLEEDEVYGYDVIVSLIDSTVKINNKDQEITIVAKTYLDNTKGIQYTEFEAENDKEEKS